MLVLERQSEPVDYRAKDFEELGDSVVPLRLVDEAVEHVADRFADEGAVRHELAFAPHTYTPLLSVSSIEAAK